MRVDMITKKLVKPHALTPPHLRCHALSLFDQNQVPAYIAVAFFYRGDNAGNVEGMLSRLEESLSQALSIYYPFAGRYVGEGCCVECNDQGVEFIVGRVDGRLDEILEMNPECPGYDFINLITKTMDQAEYLAPIVVRVHVFECGAFAICLSFFHKVADLSSTVEFMKAWASISRGGIVDEVSRPSFVVPSIFPAREQLPVQVSRSKTPSLNSEKFVKKRFEFESATLEKLELYIASVMKGDTMNTYNRPPSRVEILLGLVWKVLVKIDGLKINDDLRPLAFLTAMNLRGKAGMLTPKNAFGNLCTDAYCETSKEDREMELLGFVRMVQKTIKNARNKYVATDNAEGFRAIVEEDASNITRIRGIGQDKHVFLSSSWCGFGLYEVDFGFGKPELVLNTGPPVRIVILMDGRLDNGGLDVLAILDEVEMTHFKKEIMDIIEEMKQ